MSLEVIPRRGSALGRTDRQLADALRRSQVPGKVAAAKIESAAFAAHVAMAHAGSLSALEGRLIQQAPVGEGRYRAIADAFAGYACQELSLLAFRDGPS
jgi:hypothetical protein